MDFLYQSIDGRVLARATPVLLFTLAILAIAYRYYSAFLAARVLCLDDARPTPAVRLADGHNYHVTNRWVLFGHHFAAISGAGPLIGPVLAIQYGYLPGLVWLVVGVCFAGAVQDMVVLAASVRRDGKSLAEIVRAELGPWAHLVASAAILFIVIIALAGLGFVVVKALGGEKVALPAGLTIMIPEGKVFSPLPQMSREEWLFEVPPKATIRMPSGGGDFVRPEAFTLQLPASEIIPQSANQWVLPAGCQQVIPGSSWGLFTIACTVPIALLVSAHMYWLRPGKVLEASLLGAVLVLGATWLGSLVPGSVFEKWFQLGQGQTVLVLCAYGFIASILPVWLLLCPRDYISSFLKIGTIALLVVGTCLANPLLLHRPVEPVFASGGPTFRGSAFPFVFICVMCGAVSGFHALVSSGTTPKMVGRERDVRLIGYGSMLLEGLVAVVALIAAASLDPRLYYDINVDLRRVSEFQGQIDRLHRELGEAGNIQHLNIAQVEERVEETLRGRVGGAVTLAVGMAQILTKPLEGLGVQDSTLFGYWKYWYHFAIMFEALFILTTIDTGTRIARYLVQETMGRIHPALGSPAWLPGTMLASLVVTLGWGLLVATGSIDTIWPMFGIANQLLAVVGLATVAVMLAGTRRRKYLWVLLVPMLFVLSTTMTAGYQMVVGRFPAMMQQPATRVSGALSLVATVFVISTVCVFLAFAMAKIMGRFRAKPDDQAF
jgi:carbon starvation protein